MINIYIDDNILSHPWLLFSIVAVLVLNYFVGLLTNFDDCGNFLPLGFFFEFFLSLFLSLNVLFITQV